MSDNDTKLPTTAEETRDFIAQEAEVAVAIMQPALNMLADRWANDVPELARVRKMAQIAAVRGLGAWMRTAMRDAGADHETLQAVDRMSDSMEEAFARMAAAQLADEPTGAGPLLSVVRS